MIIDQIEAEENFSLTAPFMQKVSLLGNSIMIKDNRIGRMVELQVRGKEIVCMHCNKKDCVHVGFAYAVPEVYRLMKVGKAAK